MIRCNSIIKINTQRLRELSQAQITALEQTAEALHDEVKQAQVFPPRISFSDVRKSVCRR